MEGRDNQMVSTVQRHRSGKEVNPDGETSRKALEFRAVCPAVEYIGTSIKEEENLRVRAVREIYEADSAKRFQNDRVRQNGSD